MKPMRQVATVFVLLLLGSTVVPAQTVNVSFDDMEPGKPPRNFVPAQTGPGRAPRWSIVEDATAPSGRLVVRQTDEDETGSRFPLLILSGMKVADASVSVRFKAISGVVDRAAGLVVRFQDKDHYYCVRTNSLEDNIRLYKVVEGRRIQFGGVDHRLTREGEWHLLRLDVQGTRFRVFMNRDLLFEAEDATFQKPGEVGLWTKGDSVTSFDDLRVEPPRSMLSADFEKPGKEGLPIGFSAVVSETAVPPTPWRLIDEPGGTKGSRALVVGEKAPEDPQLRAPGGGGRGGVFFLSDAPKSGDLAVLADFRTGAAAPGMQVAGLVACYADKDNHYLLRINPRESNVRLYRVAGGTRKQIGEVHHTTFDETEWHRAVLDVDGNRLTVLIDGAVQIEATDETLPKTGRAGIWAYPGSGVRFASLAVETSRRSAEAAPAR